ncbi:MAG TPA: DNA-binding protein [Erysipelothrix sp.]
MNFNNQQVQMVLSLRLRQLQESGLEGIALKDLEAIFGDLFKRKYKANRISDLVDLIFTTSDDDIVKMLAVHSKKEAYYHSIADYSDLLTGDGGFEK